MEILNPLPEECPKLLSKIFSVNFLYGRFEDPENSGRHF